jgi:hypothetical protein
MAVAREAMRAGLVKGLGETELDARITARVWMPRYLPYRRMPEPGNTRRESDSPAAAADARRSRTAAATA